MFSAVVLYFAYGKYLQSLVNRPFNDNYQLSPILPLNTWGTFRSGHYIGLKTSSPLSMVAGLMWFTNHITGNTLPIRHWCDHHDRLDKYQWNKHDFSTFGIQEIVDGNLMLHTSFMKFVNESWTLKVSAKSKVNLNSSVNTLPISIILYVAKENQRDYIEVVPFEDQLQPHSVFMIRGETQNIGKFQTSITITKDKSNVLFRSYLNTVTQPPLVYLKETILKNIYMYNVEDLYPYKHLFVIKSDEPQSKEEKQKINFIAHQIVFYPPIDVEMHFQPLESNKTMVTDPSVNETYDSELKKRSVAFDADFELKFNLKEKNFSDGEINFAKSVVSNMIGSIGYFYGYSDVKSKYTPEPVPYGPLQLLSAVPSRSFFPRGFLWDEGFHDMLINHWDPNLSLTIIKGWLNLMNNEGWIPREVILGVEARARVPPEFVVQHNSNANPPAMFFAIESLMNMNVLNNSVLSEIYPRLEAWFQWFNTSQIGEYPSTYRWRGRDKDKTRELNPKTLTSGLDDYPRATHPTSEEIHLDLRCWIAYATRVMARIAHLIGKHDKDKYQHSTDFLSDNNILDKWHWSEEYQMYTDKGLHSTNVKLEKVITKSKDTEIKRKVITPPTYGFVPELGYVSLFPLMLNIIKPDNPKLQKIFDDIENPNLLWTSYGIRSLSRKSIYYQQYNTDVDPPYWRGAIWINMNYLILKSLNHYSKVSGPYQNRALSIYKSLRHNLISTIYTEFVRSGYIWEQYNDSTGRGHGTHPFTGWSALIVLIMGEKY